MVRRWVGAGLEVGKVCEQRWREEVCGKRSLDLY